MSNLRFDAEFELTESLAFDALDSNDNTVGTMVLDKGNISYYDLVKSENVDFGEDADKFNQFVKDNNLRFAKTSERKWIEYNPNPQDKHVGDCTIRAYCKATGFDWNKCYDIAVKYGKKLSTIPNDSHAVHKILEEEFGFERMKLEKADKVTINTFAQRHKTGTYVIGVRAHLVTVKDGHYYDTWDSGDKKISYVYKAK